MARFVTAEDGKGTLRVSRGEFARLQEMDWTSGAEGGGAGWYPQLCEIVGREVVELIMEWTAACRAEGRSTEIAVVAESTLAELAEDGARDGEERRVWSEGRGRRAVDQSAYRA